MSYGGGVDAVQPLEAGEPTVVGPYRLLGRLGSGGMGRVCLGRSAGGRTFAVKAVHPHVALDEDRRLVTSSVARKSNPSTCTTGRHESRLTPVGADLRHTSDNPDAGNPTSRPARIDRRTRSRRGLAEHGSWAAHGPHTLSAWIWTSG